MFLEKRHKEIIERFGFEFIGNNQYFREFNGYDLQINVHQNTFDFFIGYYPCHNIKPILSGSWESDSLRLYTFLNSIINP